MNHELMSRIEQQPLAAVIEYYAACLPDNQRALDFLQRQALSADGALKVGFADRTLGTHLPSNRIKAGVQVRTKLQSAGILKASGHETFRGYVTVPLTAADGTITGIYGLRIDPHGPGDFITSIGSGLFNAAALQSFAEIILCQDPLDAWMFCAAGHTNAIATVGIELTSDLLENVERVLLTANVDHDLFPGKELLRIHFPDDTSVHQYAIDHPSLEDCLGDRIRAASWISGAPQPAVRPESKPVVASPVPTASDDLEVVQSDSEVVSTIENRRWRVRGLERNLTTGVLRLNVAVFNERSGRFHVDQFDLYHSRSRRVFLKEAAEETGLVEADLRHDLGRLLLKLEELQQQQLGSGCETKQETVTLSDAERSEAMGLLRDEHLLDHILDDFDACGIVGEQAGKLAGYLAATSRLLEKPLGLVIQSSSAAGKSALADSILRFMPPEALFRCSAMTSQSLYYLGKENLQHKILSIAEEEGVREAAYQLKLLQSEGQLSLVSTSKETGTGRTTAERYEVRGPVALLMTTTSLSVDPELMNRCLVISVDESDMQTEAIVEQQRQADTLAGLQRRTEHELIIRRQQNAQRLLRPLTVVNPYADQLKFITHQARHRRDHQKYLSLIKTVTLLHQHQRDIKQLTLAGKQVEYLEVTRRDIALANKVADWALGRTIDDLSGPTRRLLLQLYHWLCETAKSKRLELSEVLFTRRQAREMLGWSATPMRVHLERLCRDEYVLPHGGGNGRLARYSLLFDGRGREGEPAFTGLVDPASLKDPASDPTTDNLTGR